MTRGSANYFPIVRGNPHSGFAPGSTVRTRMIHNARDLSATWYGVGRNPATGRSYIEGALAGDTVWSI